MTFLTASGTPGGPDVLPGSPRLSHSSATDPDDHEDCYSPAGAALEFGGRRPLPACWQVKQFGQLGSALAKMHSLHTRIIDGEPTHLALVVPQKREDAVAVRLGAVGDELVARGCVRSEERRVGNEGSA